MKKSILLIAMAIMTIASFGQTNAATRAASDNEVPWAYDLQDEVVGDRLGRNKTGEFGAAMYVAGDGILKGAKVTSIEIPSAIEGMKDVKVWIRESLMGANIVTATIPGIDINTYGKAILSQEYEIPEKGFYVGYTFVSPETFPILFSGVDHKEACWLKCPDEDWMDLYEYGYGSVAIRLNVTGKEFPKNSLSIHLGKKSMISMAGEEARITHTISSFSSNDITSYKLCIDNGEKQYYQTVNLSDDPIKAGLGRTVTRECAFEVAKAVSAKNSVTFSIVEVNGEPNTSSNASATLTTKTGAKGGTRRTLVEENTGTGCGYCPYGIAAMETMKERYGDKFIGIALHQFNSGDPMYLIHVRYYNLGMSSAPAVRVDRSEEIHPVYLNGVFETYNSIPPLADVSVDGYWNEDGTAVEVTSDIKVLTNDLNLSVAYVLVADGLSNTSLKWCQYNYLASADPSNYSHLWYYENIKEFMQGGKYASDKVLGLTFNDVAVSTSYVNYSTEIPPYTETALGDNINNSYTLKLNASEELMRVIDRSKTSVVVILEDEDGNIVNAAKAPVKAYSTGIDDVMARKDNAGRIYNIRGYETSKCSKGINIIMMPDGTVRKVVK